MKVTKTIESRAVNLTKKKQNQLKTEYENLQKYLHNQREDLEIYSAKKQQAKRYYDLDKIKEDKEYYDLASA